MYIYICLHIFEYRLVGSFFSTGAIFFVGHTQAHVRSSVQVVSIFTWFHPRSPWDWPRHTMCPARPMIGELLTEVHWVGCEAYRVSQLCGCSTHHPFVPAGLEHGVSGGSEWRDAAIPGEYTTRSMPPTLSATTTTPELFKNNSDCMIIPTHSNLQTPQQAANECSQVGDNVDRGALFSTQASSTQCNCLQYSSRPMERRAIIVRVQVLFYLKSQRFFLNPKYGRCLFIYFFFVVL